MKIHYFFTSLLLFWRSVSSSFTDVTERVGIGAINGYLAAFGDFNGDKKTDLFVVTDEGKQLSQLISQSISHSISQSVN